MKLFLLQVASTYGFSAVPVCEDAAQAVVTNFLHDRFIAGVPQNASSAMEPYMHNSCQSIASDSDTNLCAIFGVERVCCASCTERRQSRWIGAVSFLEMSPMIFAYMDLPAWLFALVFAPVIDQLVKLVAKGHCLGMAEGEKFLCEQRYKKVEKMCSPSGAGAKCDEECAEQWQEWVSDAKSYFEEHCSVTDPGGASGITITPINSRRLDHRRLAPPGFQHRWYGKPEEPPVPPPAGYRPPRDSRLCQDESRIPPPRTFAQYLNTPLECESVIGDGLSALARKAASPFETFRNWCESTCRPRH